MALLMDRPTSGKCTRKEAFSTDLIPERTDTYQPLSNEELVMMINTVADQFGMKLTDEQLGMDLKGMRFFGVYTVEGFDFFGGRIKLMIGFANSYNKSMSGKVCIGGRVMVCSNEAFYAYTDETTGIGGLASHEHRRNIHDGLYQRICHAFEGIETFRKQQEIFYGHLNERPISQEEALAMSVRAAQKGVINKTRILTVAEEWQWQERGPQNEAEKMDGRIWYPEFKPRTAYSLFNAFTEVQKDRLQANPVQTNIQTMGLSEFFYAEYEQGGAERRKHQEIVKDWIRRGVPLHERM